MTLSFTIPGDPRGKGRPRFASYKAADGANRTRTYTDDKTASYENLVALAAAAALAGRLPYQVPVDVRVEAIFSVPKSATKKHHAEMLAGDIHHTKLPDLDNVVKAVLDGCNQVAFVDDRLVVSLNGTKAYGAAPMVRVTVTPLIQA